MTRKQYTATVILTAALFIMFYYLPVLVDSGQILSGIILGMVCSIAMAACLLLGELDNIAPDEEREIKEET